MRRNKAADSANRKRTQDKTARAGAGLKPAGLALVDNRIKIIKEQKSFYKTAVPIAFISGRIGSIFVTSVVRGAEERVRGFGKNMYELNHYPAGARKNGAGEAVREILDGEKASGIIILSMVPDDGAVEMLKKSRVPAVFIERRITGLHSVTIDNFRGGYEAARRLINGGRKKLGVILDPQTRDINAASHQRLQGFKKALKDAGIKLRTDCTTGVDVHTIETGRQAFEKITGCINKMDGIFSVAGDLAAIGFMIEAKSHGIRIPQELAIIGFDDIDMAAATEPALTTVRQPISGMGSFAVEMIHESLSGRLEEPKNLVLGTELIIRGTA
jgi:DNA-binding LacI/PurR family transcriptional regulator